MAQRVTFFVVVALVAVFAWWGSTKLKMNHAAAAVVECKAGLNEQCPSDQFRTEYLGWKELHERIVNLKDSDGKISTMTHLDREWKGWRDDLTSIAQQECPGCTFDDKTLKFTKPVPPAAPTPPKK